MGPGSFNWILALWAVLLGCALLHTQPTAALEKRPVPQELTSCINDGVEDQFTTYKDFAYKKPIM